MDDVENETAAKIRAIDAALKVLFGRLLAADDEDTHTCIFPLILVRMELRQKMASAPPCCWW